VGVNRRILMSTTPGLSEGSCLEEKPTAIAVLVQEKMAVRPPSISDLDRHLQLIPTVVAGGSITSGGPSCTSRVPAEYLAGNGAVQRPDVPGPERRAAGSAGKGRARRYHRPAGRRYTAGTRQVHVQTARPGRLLAAPSAPSARAVRYGALAAASALMPGSPTASGAGGGGGEPVAVGLVGDHLRDTEGGELVQGVGDCAGRPGERLADLVRGEGRVGELAQVLLDQVAERAGPGSPRRAGRWRRP
jgi:hypothetical protein